MGSWRSPGTGRPLSFRCSACRRRYGTDEYFDRAPIGSRERGYANHVKLTGKKRACTTGTAGVRNDTHAREYVCQDCGHQGWSRHTDLRSKEKR